MEGLHEHFVEMIRQCIEYGMKLPLIVCAVSPNGNVLVTRFNEGYGPETLAEHVEDCAFKMPVKCDGG